VPLSRKYFENFNDEDTGPLGLSIEGTPVKNLQKIDGSTELP